MTTAQLKFITSMRSGEFISGEDIHLEGLHPVYGGNGLRGFTHTVTHSLTAPLIGRQGALCGNVNFATGDFYATEHAIVAKPRDGVHPRWLYWALLSLDLNQYSMAAAQPGLSVEVIERVRAVFPSQLDQERIANFLDDKTARIDALIAEKERLIQLLGEHRLSISARVLADIPAGLRAKLGFHVDLLPGNAFSSDEFSRDSGHIPLLRGINVAPGSIRWDETVYWPPVYESTLERFKLRVNDVVLGMDRPWISSGARVAMIDEASAGSFLLQRVCRLRGGDKFDQRFLFYVLSSDEFRQFIEVDLTGVSVPHISPEQILSFKVPVLTIEEQRARCRAADMELLKIEQLEELTAIILARLREYRSSLISAAVTGQLNTNFL